MVVVTAASKAAAWSFTKSPMLHEARGARPHAVSQPNWDCESGGAGGRMGTMLSDPAAERARRQVVRLARSGLDAPSLLAAVAGAVQEIVRYDGAVWATVDPATMLITGALVEDLPRDSAAAFYENEYLHDDVNKFTRLARGQRPVATAGEATDGDLSRSRLHREVGSAFGFMGDALRAAFVVDGSCWGVAALGRRRPEPLFSQAEVSFMASFCRTLADGLRAAILLDALGPPSGADGVPGLVLLDPDHTVSAATPAAQAWLEELAGDYGLRASDRAPAALRAVAARARDAGAPDGADPESAPRARLRTRSGRWLVLYGLPLGAAGATGAQTAVVIQEARPPEVAPLIVAAYGLSAREREVAQRVILGSSTAEIAGALFISPYTVQDHLKAIFDKVGVRSRGELVKQVFERHYLPSRRSGFGPRTG